MVSPKRKAATLAGSDNGLPVVDPATSLVHKVKPLSLLPVVALIFYDVSGGPYGSEDAVSAGGPLLAILGFIILPLVWSVPEALVTAELATAFPENSGYVAWVTAAFGPFWGFQEGFWSWLSGVTDNSIYPVMAAANLEIFFPVLKSGWPRMVFLVVFSLVLSYLNYRGLTVVGTSAVITTIFILIPFTILCVMALPHADPKNWLVFEPKEVDWVSYINVMFWNLNFWDSVSTLAGEVEQPEKTFPRAMLISIVVVNIFYVLPLMAGIGVLPSPGEWRLGYFGMVAQKVGGKWLALWVVAAAAVSQVGQYQAEMSSDSYQLQGMAERGFLPKALAYRSKHDTPTYGIVLSSLGIMCLASFDFVSIVEMLNAIYCLAEAVEFLAYIWLRIKAPDLHRPYKVPLPTWGLVLMLLPAYAFLILLLGLPFYRRKWFSVGVTLGAIALGFLLYPLMKVARERKWCEFNEVRFDFTHPLLDTIGGAAVPADDDVTQPLLAGEEAENGDKDDSPRFSLEGASPADSDDGGAALEGTAQAAAS